MHVEKLEELFFFFFFTNGQSSDYQKKKKINNKMNYLDRVSSLGSKQITFVIRDGLSWNVEKKRKKKNK